MKKTAIRAEPRKHELKNWVKFLSNSEALGSGDKRLKHEKKQCFKHKINGANLSFALKHQVLTLVFQVVFVRSSPSPY